MRIKGGERVKWRRKRVGGLYDGKGGWKVIWGESVHKGGVIWGEGKRSSASLHIPTPNSHEPPLSSSAQIQLHSSSNSFSTLYSTHSPSPTHLLTPATRSEAQG